MILTVLNKLKLGGALIQTFLQVPQRNKVQRVPSYASCTYAHCRYRHCCRVPAQVAISPPSHWAGPYCTPCTQVGPPHAIHPQAAYFFLVPSRAFGVCERTSAFAGAFFAAAGDRAYLGDAAFTLTAAGFLVGGSLSESSESLCHLTVASSRALSSQVSTPP